MKELSFAVDPDAGAVFAEAHGFQGAVVLITESLDEHPARRAGIVFPGAALRGAAPVTPEAAVPGPVSPHQQRSMASLHPLDVPRKVLACDRNAAI